MTVFEDARPADLPALTALWKTCFGDSEGSIRMFWDSLFPHIRVTLARLDKTLGAMACALPVSLIDDCGESHSAVYFYAVCTAPKLRGQGLCRKLLAHTEDSLRQQGVEFSLLVPSSPSLFSFYEALGYRTAFFHQNITLPPKKAPAKITRLDAEGYRNLREMMLFSSFVSYDTPLLHYQQRVSEALGAGLYRIDTEDQIYCAAAERHGDKLLLKELLPGDPSAAAALAYELGCSQVQMRSEGGELPFGMVKALQGCPPPEEAYLGLAFD